MNHPRIPEIEKIIQSKPIAVFMKGSLSFPACGFSAKTCEVLKAAGATPDQIAHFDVLADRELFQVLKEFNNWPTSPQVFIKGQFVGGCDIVTEMYESGELQKLVTEATRPNA